MEKIKSINDYRHFTGPAELHKAINTLRGLVAGITTDAKINVNEIEELTNWCLLHAHLESKHPFNELLPKIRNAYQDGILDESEASDIIWLCNNFVSDSKYYELQASSLQFLFGLLHGIMADEVITDDEIKKLNEWLIANDFLEGTYPFDEIRSLVSSILLDGIITNEERDILMALIGEFIDTSVSYNINKKILDELKEKYSLSGICSNCKEIDFSDKLFCFTGKSSRSSRNEIAATIEQLGGIFKDRIVKDTAFLVVGIEGNPCWIYSCYGRKIEQAVEMRKNGSKIKIISEIDFWDIVDDLL